MAAQFLSGGQLRPIGCGGLPVAFPYFGQHNGSQPVEDEIRHRHQSCLFDYPSNPNIPKHWFHAGNGWVGHYFYDVQPFDWTTQSNGVFKCQVRLPDGRLCDHQVVNDGHCDGNCCWNPKTTAVGEMLRHVHEAHGISAPPTNGQWATELCDTEGCLDVICCAPCHGSRQMMALSGYSNEFNGMWCACCALFPVADKLLPWMNIACLTRYSVVKLQRIDEGVCQSCLVSFFCSVCSVAQTYREFSVAGVWPGGNCNAQPPSCCSVPRPPLMGSSFGGQPSKLCPSVQYGTSENDSAAVVDVYGQPLML